MPTLVYTAEGRSTKRPGEPVAVGDIVKGLHNKPSDEKYEVIYFAEPRSPASSGKVTIRRFGADHGNEVFVSIIGAEWVGRTDR